MAVLQCLSLMIIIGSLQLPEIALPPPAPTPPPTPKPTTANSASGSSSSGAGIDVAALFNLSNFVIFNSTTSAVRVTLNDTFAGVDFLTDTIIQVRANAVVKGGDHTEFFVRLRVPATGSLRINTQREPSTCYTRNATLDSCTISPEVVDIGFSPETTAFEKDLADLLNTTLSLGPQIRALTCNALSAAIITHLTNRTDLPLVALSPPTVGSSDIRDVRLFRMVLNIVQALPAIDGVRIAVDASAANALHISASFLTDLTVATTNASLMVPAGMALALDVVFPDLRCTTGTTCVLGGGVTLANVRVTGAGSVDQVVDDVVGPLLSGLASVALPALLNATGGAASNATGPLISLKQASVVLLPSVAALAVIGAAAIAGVLGTLAYCYVRHRQAAVFDERGRRVGFCRTLSEDIIIVVGSYGLMAMFAVSNCSTAAEMVLGGEVTLYAFSLSNTVHDMWHAGLYALSFFVALFSGGYPYFKLLVILLYSVVWRQPQSRVLRWVDLLGKFSLLDSFVMVIMATSLVVPGLAEIHLKPSFWLFVAATLLSILLGNYATHGWRREERAAAATAAAASGSSDEQRVSPLLTAATTGSSRAAASPSTKTPLLLSRTNGNVYGNGSGQAHGGAAASPDSIAHIPPNRPSAASLVLPSGGPTVRDDDDAEGQSPTLASVAWLHRWFGCSARRAALAVLMGIACSALVGIPLFAPSLSYEMKGLAALITGSVRTYSLSALYLKNEVPLAATAIATVHVLPAVFCFFGMRLRFLASWCASDVFMLACLAGLLQLEQFVKFIMGPNSEALFDAHATYGWGLYCLAAGVLLQWALMVFVASDDAPASGPLRLSPTSPLFGPPTTAKPTAQEKNTRRV